MSKFTSVSGKEVNIEFSKSYNFYGDCVKVKMVKREGFKDLTVIFQYETSDRKGYYNDCTLEEFIKENPETIIKG